MEETMSSSKHKTLIFSIILYAIIFILNCSNNIQKTAARVGGRIITVQEFEVAFAKGKKTKQIQAASLEEKMAVLNRMIDKKLKIIDAYQQNLDKDEKVQITINERMKGAMFRHLIDREVVDKIISESMIKDYYKKASKEVKIRQIVLNVNKKDSNNVEIQAKAKKIVRRLREGEDFADVAKTMSDDKKTANDGGKKGFLKWGVRSSENPMYVAAFSMDEGDISDPIEMPEGYYIIKVTNIKKHPVPPYEKEKERIKQSIFRLFSKDIESAYYEYLDGLKSKYKMKFNDKAIDLFFERFTSKKTVQENSPDSVRDNPANSNPFDKFSDSDKQKVLVEFSFSEIKINYFLEELKKFPPQRLPQFTAKEQVRSILNQRIIPIVILEHEVEKKNIKNDKEIKKKIKEYQESLMENNIYQTQVTNKVSVNDEDTEKYFNAHREDYKHPAMREVQDINVNDKTTAELIVSAARKGQKFTGLFNKYNEKKALSKNKGKIGLISKGRAGLGKPAFDTQIGGISEPIKIGKTYSVIKVLSEKPETLKTFEESKKVAAARYRREATTLREKEWLTGLREKISVAVYEKNVEEACKNVYGSDVKLAE
jgi:parvulin-like peptidyl-prolyl isomerase